MRKKNTSHTPHTQNTYYTTVNSIQKKLIKDLILEFNSY